MALKCPRCYVAVILPCAILSWRYFDGAVLSAPFCRALFSHSAHPHINRAKIASHDPGALCYLKSPVPQYAKHLTGNLPELK